MPACLSRPLALAAAAALLLIVVPAASADEPEFQPLFNGTDLSGWHGRPHLDPRKYPDVDAAQKEQWASEMATHWTIEGDEIVNDGHGPYLTTDRDYGDFELRLEYKTVPRADSGIYLRGVPQVQIWDSTEEAKFGIGADKGSGGLWNNSPGAPGKDPLVLADKPFGEWNTMRIVMVGERVSVWLNEALVVDHARMENFWQRDQPLFATGPIQLQTHGGEIRWRNMQIREFDADQANAILAAHGEDEGFRSLFDGHSLAGWTGAVDDYMVDEGSIVCRPGRGGNLFTEEVYSDFVVRLEFQLPPGGNNGLAIRYPGKGNPSNVAMCELQVLDDSHPKYARLDPRQYHGSAYGMVPAHRGYLRPVGEWNFQETRVEGSKIRVELNGTRILDADLSEVSEFMRDSQHPGKDRTEGHFGFCGHSDPVRFREIRLLSLED